MSQGDYYGTKPNQKEKALQSRREDTQENCIARESTPIRDDAYHLGILLLGKVAVIQEPFSRMPSTVRGRRRECCFEFGVGLMNQETLDQCKSNGMRGDCSLGPNRKQAAANR